MNTKLLRIWYIVAGSFAALAIIYYIVLLFNKIFSEEYPSAGLLKLNNYAIISFIIALLLLIALIPFSKIMEKKAAKVEIKKHNDNELLAKYKSKKVK